MFSLQILSALMAVPAIWTVAHARSVPASSSFSQVKFARCPSSFGDLDSGFDCGALEVPIDWDNPYGEKIQLAMLRHNATKPEQRIGSLFFNPGGPGYSSVPYIEGAVQLFGDEVSDRFDIIGLDPRGVGISSPIKCDPEYYNQRVSLWPSNQIEFDALVNKYAKFGESCYNMTGPLVKHMDSVSVAKDIEAIRQGLGDEKLNYLGLSYGTLIGQTYAELFPQNIRTMVLDGNMDHSTDLISYLTVKSFTYETELVRFTEWCGPSKECPFNGTSAAILKIWDDLLAKADKKPLPAPSCKVSGTCRADVTREEILNSVNSMLWFKSGPFQTWNKLGKALYSATKGDASGFSDTLALNSSSTSFQGQPVSCLDWDHPEESLVALKYQHELASSQWPHVKIGDDGRNKCIGWPFPAVNKVRRANIIGTPRILLINSQFDPSCSYIWANGLRDQIQNSTLLTRKGDGHTSYTVFGESRDIANNYFVNMTLPADNTIVNS